MTTTTDSKTTSAHDGAPGAPTPDADTVENAGYNQHGHGKGGTLGEGEPEGHREDDGSTQPNFGQTGNYGKDPA